MVFVMNAPMWQICGESSEDDIDVFVGLVAAGTMSSRKFCYHVQ